MKHDGPASRWRYGRLGALEAGWWAGDAAPALDLHFHDEHQVTLVLSGERWFRIAGDTVRVPAGSGLHIPAGVPHASLPVRCPGTRCLNLYGTTPGRMGPEDSADPATSWALQLAMTDEPVGRLASERGLSREAFTRRFARQFGIAPHAFRLAWRLNQARQRLRSGVAPADVAAELGFSDQSHLGRHFRRVYGTTPGEYRSALGITNVPDDSFRRTP